MTTLTSASLSRHSRSIEPILLAHALTVCLGLGLAVTCTLHNYFVKVAILKLNSGAGKSMAPRVHRLPGESFHPRESHTALG